MLVSQRAGADPSVMVPVNRLVKLRKMVAAQADGLPSYLYCNKESSAFSTAWFPAGTAHRIRAENADIVNLHWINEGYVSVEEIGRIDKPLVWTLHDMWAFTGGCHYSGPCDGFKGECGNCPQLGSRRSGDLSRLNVSRKLRSWACHQLTIVTPSHWLGDLARKSRIFQNKRIEVIPNGIDLDRFRPIDPSWARSILGLDHEKRWLLFGAWGGTTDPRKGFDLLQQALLTLAADHAWEDNIGVITFGGHYPTRDGALPFPTKSLGELNDEISLVLAYNAADAFIAPSREDNLPNTILEALACGIPSVAFQAGGIPDLIEHEITGWLARPYHVEELAEGIKWVLLSRERGQNLKRNARQKAEKEFALELQASRYLSLFNEVLQ
jgi:glycosyltransferase involved in cell wall biosynthesis